MLRTIMMKTSKRARKAVPVLTLVIPLAALISIANVAISMGTSNWLYSYEIIPTQSNSSVMEEFITRRTISGLWYLCSFNVSGKPSTNTNIVESLPPKMNCSTIDYFQKDKYVSDPNDSTNAIRYAVTQAGPLFVVASILLGIAVVAAAFGYQRHRRIALFIAGIVFIISGLMLLIGLVVYLSALQSEIGSKLRPRNAVDMAQFSYYYGFSFVLVVVGFMATEMTGIMAIFYYIYWHQLDWTEKLATDDNGNGKYPSDSSYRCQSHLHTAGQRGGHKIKDIYDINPKKRSACGNQGSAALLPHHPECNAYLVEKDKHSCGRDFDIPFPPPPPPTTAYLSIPRDYTNLNSCSDDEGSILFPPPAALSRKDRDNRERDSRNTPL